MYLGLDLGTSGIRALLVDSQGAVVGEAAAACHVSHPQPGWSEQNPEDWITACDTAVMALRQDHPKSFAALRAIGLSGHMHGATLLDASDQVLRPCILWNDTRATAEAAELDQMPDVRRISGNIVFPGFTAPKLVWVRNHEPEVFDQIAKVLLPKDYLRFWLTGEMVSDMSDSAGIRRHSQLRLCGSLSLRPGICLLSRDGRFRHVRRKKDTRRLRYSPAPGAERLPHHNAKRSQPHVRKLPMLFCCQPCCALVVL